MKESRLHELLSAAEDEALTDAEGQELGAALAESAEARQFAEQARLLGDFLSNARSLEPPPGLAGEVLARLRPVDQDQPKSVNSWRQWLFAPAMVGYACAAAVGALLVAVVYEMRPELVAVPDSTYLVGALSPKALIDDAVPIDALALDVDGVSVRARTDRRGDTVILELLVDAARPVLVEATLVGHGLTFEGSAQAPDGAQSIWVDSQHLQVDGLGKQRIVALLQREADANSVVEEVHVEISSDGNLLQEGILSVLAN
jgi:hypothetical protein